jgi:hypothetical protein
VLLCEISNPKSFKPTEHERQAIAIALVATTPQMAQMQLLKNEKLSYGCESLLKLGLLNVDGNGGITVSDGGYDLAQAQALWDGSQPTEQATQLASQ